MINSKLLMSGVEYFAVEELNPYSHKNIQPDLEKAQQEYRSLQNHFLNAGIEIVSVPAPVDCQDAIYTANWGLCRGRTAVLSNLPNMRRAEEPFAEEELRKLGYKLLRSEYKFSGQGDALPCGDLLFVGRNYRTDVRTHQFLRQNLDMEIISVETIPELDADGNPVTNEVTGWADSFFYDLDLALSVISPDLIAWCPEAFTPESQDLIASTDVGKIEVSLVEAKEHFACNLVSTGKTVIMSDNATQLQGELESRGLEVLTPPIEELVKGGGYIRCTSLSLEN